MQKIGNRSGKYWIDKNGNRWNRIVYNEHEAERLSKTLINSKNCVNSEYLINCDVCNGCRNSIDLINCKDCDESSGCIDSYDLKSCIRCTECQSCEKCEDCNECFDCIGCTGLHKVKHYTNNEKVEY